MLTQCPHCGTSFEIAAETLPPSGLHVHCTHCQRLFSALFAAPAPQSPAPLLVRQVSGALYNPGDMATLQRWIVERRVIRDDLVARDGHAWQRLGNLPELAMFFRAAQPGTGSGDADPGAVTANVPAPQSTRAVMPRLHAELDADTGDIHVAAERRDTGRRRTASRATLDDVFAGDFATSAFSFTDEYRDAADMSAARRNRRARRLFGVLLVSSVAAVSLYVVRPRLVADWVALLQRAPVADVAVHAVSEGYRQLAVDSIGAIGAASAAFESASKIDGHYAEARAGYAEAQLALAESYSQLAADRAAAAKKERGKRSTASDDARQNAVHAAERAFGAAKEALTLAPQSVAANRAMADYYRIAGADLAKVRPLLDRARAAAPDDARVIAVGAAALAERDPDAAILHYLRALDLDPQFNRARYRLARLYLTMHDRDAALAQVEAILKAAPAHELAQELLTQLQPSAAPPGVPIAAPVAVPAAVSAPAPAAVSAPAPAAIAAPAPAAIAAPAPAAIAAPAPAAIAAPAPAAIAAPAPAAIAAPAPAAIAAPAPAAIAAPAPAAVSAPAPAAIAAPPAAALPAAEIIPADASYMTLVEAGRSLRSQHQTQAAMELYQRAVLKDGSNPAAYIGLGWCRLDNHQLDAAIATFSAALEKGPWVAEAHFGAAEAQRAKGNRRAAIKHHRQVLVIQPDGSIAQRARQMLEELSQ